MFLTLIFRSCNTLRSQIKSLFQHNKTWHVSTLIKKKKPWYLSKKENFQYFLIFLSLSELCSLSSQNSKTNNASSFTWAYFICLLLFLRHLRTLQVYFPPFGSSFFAAKAQFPTWGSIWFLCILFAREMCSGFHSVWNNNALLRQ